MNPKISRMREIVKERAEINNIGTKKAMKRISEASSWFFEMINKVDKPLGEKEKMREKEKCSNKSDHGWKGINYNGSFRN